MSLTGSVLSAEQREHFLQYGFIAVPNCLDVSVGSPAQQWREATWQRTGYDPNDQASWEPAKVHLPTEHSLPVRQMAPQAYAIMDELTGFGRMQEEPHWSDALIVNYRHMADAPRQEPNRDLPGWHKDGDFFLHFLDSPEQALLVIVCFGDVAAEAGPTWIAADSVAPVAQFLAARPAGVSPFGRPLVGEPDGIDRIDMRPLMDACHDFRALPAEAGTVVFMHPFMLHTASPNWAKVPRFITNPNISLREPFCFNRPAGDYSLVEQATLRGLGVDSFDFQITGQRTRLVPPRMGGQFRT